MLSTQLQNGDFHDVKDRMKTIEKYIKMKNARAKRAKVVF